MLPECLVQETVPTVWGDLRKTLANSPPEVILDASAVRTCDGVGLGMLTQLQRLGRAQGVAVKLDHMQGSLKVLWDQLQAQPEQSPRPVSRHERLVSTLGRVAHNLHIDLKELVIFVGKLVLTLLYLLTHPRHFRGSDFLRLLEQVGVNALGLIALLGLLFGLIMSFSSAMPLRQFGVEIYIADLVAYAVVRVLGPFITAIIVAGRSGAAFAAELGTMKIRNELDALQVMNLDPMRFLVVPRVAAATVMTPLLAMVASVMGILGCVLVLLSLSYPIVSIWNHIQGILTGTDIWIGMVKSLVFGGLVGAVGCLRGMQSQFGAGAVGQATTRAVVTAIVFLIIAEGIFSVLLYILNL